jgi:hypothetical protein
MMRPYVRILTPYQAWRELRLQLWNCSSAACLLTTCLSVPVMRFNIGQEGAVVMHSV